MGNIRRVLRCGRRQRIQRIVPEEPVFGSFSANAVRLTESITKNYIYRLKNYMFFLTEKIKPGERNVNSESNELL